MAPSTTSAAATAIEKNKLVPRHLDGMLKTTKVS
jgi:hypothetical protein